MNFFLLLFYRICYWISIPFIIACLIGNEDSLLNPGETEAYILLILASIFIGIGSSTLNQVIKNKGWTSKEFFTLFTSVVFGLWAFVFDV
tara:strand:- start:170 stop:439 length:270 start_codon:yes stop_codon:yes gene_type:complete